MAIFKKKSETASEDKQGQKPEGKSQSVVYGSGAQRVLVSPRVSEKAARLAGTNKYVFNVARTANKIEIKKAIEQAYKVKVLQVNIVNTPGKTRTFGRTTGKTSDKKKAVVTLREGESIKE